MTGIRRRGLGLATVSVAAVTILAACSASVPSSGPSSGTSSTGRPPAAKQSDSPAAGGNGGTSGPAATLTATTRTPKARVSLLTQTAPDALSAQFARMLFARSPVLVIAPESAPPAGGRAPDGVKPTVHAKATVHATAAVQVKTAAGAAAGAHPAVESGNVTALAREAARKAHAPLLLAAKITPQLAAEIRSLHPKAVLAEGSVRTSLAARLLGIRVVAAANDLPATGAPDPLRKVAVLVHAPTAGPAAAAISATSAAIAATAAAAGATVIPVHGWDPRADPAAIKILARLRPAAVIGIGGGFGPVVRLERRLAVAVTGVQLPGGGQVLFPGHRLVALYGHPYTPGLGALGEQGLRASIARAKAMAAPYRPLSHVPVIPAFEIIATVAQGSPGADGTYSYETPVSQLKPWVSAATKAGMYIVLDLQPGRANLLAQAKLYTSLLRQPNVGLALDSEWKLQPGQLPLRQIGHVDIGEVNSVVTWLAALTARYHLPQKLLVLHQFQLQMIRGERDLDTGNDDLAIVIHMDGQGTQADKQQTWNAVTGAAPHGVFFGWKNFFVKDDPMLSPRQTMTKIPTPVMISYQLRMSRRTKAGTVPDNEMPLIVF